MVASFALTQTSPIIDKTRVERHFYSDEHKEVSPDYSDENNNKTK